MVGQNGRRDLWYCGFGVRALPAHRDLVFSQIHDEVKGPRGLGSCLFVRMMNMDFRKTLGDRYEDVG